MKKVIWKALGFVTLATIPKVLIDTNMFKVQKIYLETDKFAEETRLRILQISDVHNKRSQIFQKLLIKKVREHAPNFIVLTGDIIDRSTKDFRSIFMFIDGLVATDIPLYFVSGNHEWENARRQRFLTELNKRNITILNNEHIKVAVNNQEINLVGIEDAATEHENMEKAFLNIVERNYTILLSHSPYIMNRYFSIPADLIISGHTHGGQIRFPFIGAVISPGKRFFPKLDKGLYKWGRGKNLYVDSGLGTSRIPIRFLNMSQISLINISGTARYRL